MLSRHPMRNFMAHYRCPCHQFLSVSYISKMKVVEDFLTCTTFLCDRDIFLGFRKKEKLSHAEELLLLRLHMRRVLQPHILKWLYTGAGASCPFVRMRQCITFPKVGRLLITFSLLPVSCGSASDKENCLGLSHIGTRNEVNNDIRK